MEKKVSHNRHDESFESKARWFQSLSLSERMDMLCAFSEMALEYNPSLKLANVKSTERRILVIRKTEG